MAQDEKDALMSPWLKSYNQHQQPLCLTIYRMLGSGPEATAFGNQFNAVVFNHWHLSAVNPAQHFRGDYFFRRSVRYLWCR